MLTLIAIALNLEDLSYKYVPPTTRKLWLVRTAETHSCCDTLCDCRVRLCRLRERHELRLLTCEIWALDLTSESSFNRALYLLRLQYMQCTVPSSLNLEKKQKLKIPMHGTISKGLRVWSILAHSEATSWCALYSSSDWQFRRTWLDEFMRSECKSKILAAWLVRNNWQLS